MRTSHEKWETFNGATGDWCTTYYAARPSHRDAVVLVDRLFPLSMYGRERGDVAAVPAAIAVCAGETLAPTACGVGRAVICTLVSQIQCILLQNLFAIVFPFNICAFSFFDKDKNPHHEGGKVFLRKKTFYSKLQVFPLKCYSQKAKNGPKCAKNGFMETPLVTCI